MNAEHPILFSGPMVRAILEGRKTQTRRVVKPQPFPDDWVPRLTRSGWRAWPRNEPNAGRFWTVGGGYGRCPYGQAGDRLWVRETWQAIHVSIDPETGCGDDVAYAEKIPKDNPGYGVFPSCGVFSRRWWSVAYAADPGFEDNLEDRGFPWRPAIHMPRWASRITLQVTAVRVQRVQEISEEDAIAEGAPCGWFERDTIDGLEKVPTDHRSGFAHLWKQINAKPGRTWADNPWVWAIDFLHLPQHPT